MIDEMWTFPFTISILILFDIKEVYDMYFLHTAPYHYEKMAVILVGLKLLLWLILQDNVPVPYHKTPFRSY